VRGNILESEDESTNSTPSCSIFRVHYSQ